MKLIYQQMLAFFAVIITVIVVLGFAFIRTTKTMIYSNSWQQLQQYATSIEKEAIRYNTNTKKVVGFNQQFLSDATAILRDQHIHFSVYDANKKVVYPNALGLNSMPGGSFYNPSISKSDWKKLKNNKTITQRPHVTFKSRSHDRPVNTPALRTIDVLVPLFYKTNGTKKFVGAISIGSFEQTLQANEQQIENNLFIALLVSGIAALLLSYILARYSVRRINRLRYATHSVAEGDFDIHVDSSHKDEIDDLADDFNGMVSSLRASNEEIKRQEKRRREFMADAAHEMRTPLTTINGILEGLAYDAIPEEDKAHSIELMQNETKRLIRLVNENLDYEKIRTGQIALNKTNFDGSEVLHNLVEQLTKKAAAADDHFDLTTPDELPVWADYDRFVQVLFNIMQNAIQFSKNGVIEVTASRSEHATVIAVQDHGIGMTPDQVKNIWERYYKADPSRKNTKYGESGLGLAISHQLVQQHGGSIEVESEANQGTRFTVTFPDEGFDKPIIED
ncbi:sensor histidine kinase [Lactiplantibacillus fabifermentans]|uniref:histidine kinase n=2 Tax=Lactiplantibacillus fabifermentans TaxID=483011 RepID=A0A0R2P2R3_9LACO|nr:HAMP domain-containing sensor histidine kinase [Lactiplantibacillus fabifermentans]ETY73706.1 signal transduction histidine kinase [Lactiplantibacillus fabifermentans T30PCM01]KRO29130.1 histidine protein kinase [Lactiplantibacillus fabifermentans DSM 21115]